VSGVSDGPTTVGSINAKLVLDIDQFIAKSEQAQAEADKLDGRKVEIKADADTGKAIAQLEALALAEQSLGDKVTVAANRVKIAQLDLDAVNQKSNATEQEKLRAQNAVMTATQQLARTLEDDTRSANDNTDAHRRNSDALKTHFSAMQLLIGASPVLLAATSALAAATVGLGLGFVAMAGAGVAAVLGIKDAMDSGSQAGKTYQAGLEVLGKDMEGLANVGAVAMLSSFNKAVDDVNGAMPTLNLLVSEGAQGLGELGGSIIPAVVGGLQQAEPLIRAGSAALSEFVGWLMSGSQSSGFEQFIGYAVANLPGVTKLLEDLVTTAGHILAAFAPMGPAVITILDGISAAANALPLPVLAAIVTFAVTVGPALNIARVGMSGFAAATGTAAAEMTVFGLSAQLAVPVIGLVLAALGGLAIAFATSGGAQQQATVNAQEYAAALQQDNDAIGANTAAQIAHKASTEGVTDAAKALGISQHDLIGYLQGSSLETLAVTNRLKAAQEAATDVSKAYVDGQTGMILYTDAQKQQGDQVKKVTDFLNANKDAIDTQIKADKDAAEATKQFGDGQAYTAAQLQLSASAFGVTTKAVEDAQKAYNDTDAATKLQLGTLQAVADKYGDTAISVQRLADSQTTIQGQFDATTLKMQEENNAAGLLKQALDLLNGGSLNLMEAQTNVGKATLSAAQSLAKNGDTVDQVDKKTGQYTAAALANQSALQSAASTAQQHATAVAQATGSTEKGTAALQADKVALENSLRAQGLLTGGVQAYIDTLFQVPPVVPTRVEVEAQQAKAELAIVQGLINSLHDRTIHLTTVNDQISNTGSHAAGVGNTGDSVPFALGGRVKYLAGGGQGDPLAFGTDTVRAMLTPDEQVINRASSNQIRRDYPGAFEYMNATGKLPPTGGGSTGPIYLTAYIVNPFTGEQVQATVRAVARDEIGNAVREAARLRPRA
jgi:hypothetical protein